jgi:hypothetical protein
VYICRALRRMERDAASGIGAPLKPYG